jgi:glutamate N-acetyltransferase/amino-acid N-acetyltransferase
MSITAASGFTAIGLHCGIKAGGVFDLAIVRADDPASAAAVFTNSSTAAPTVAHGRRAVADGQLQAFVVASGCANAGTGQAGLEAVERVVADAAGALGVDSADILVSTTGPIGPVLPDELVRAGVRNGASALTDELTAATGAARGILTTDSMTKEAMRGGTGYVIGGMAKGAGMVRPDMATMLAFVTTDAVVDTATLSNALRDAVGVTFNCLNIDGCQSTNDTVAVMASGASGITPDPAEFSGQLLNLCRDLVMQMASDAEGASRVVILEISGAADDDEAREVGKAIADAAIVRAAFYGGDPNWGRVLAAVGACGRSIDPDNVAIAYEGVSVAQAGTGVAYDEAALLATLDTGDFRVEIMIGSGRGTATVITTDLTPDYVKFNGERS